MACVVIGAVTGGLAILVTVGATAAVAARAAADVAGGLVCVLAGALAVDLGIGEPLDVIANPALIASRMCGGAGLSDGLAERVVDIPRLLVSKAFATLSIILFSLGVSCRLLDTDAGFVDGPEGLGG